MAPLRLGFLTSHPIQYHAPLFRRLARTPGVEFEALFCHDHGIKPSYDPGFGQVLQFDVPLLEGFSSRFLTNVSPVKGSNFLGQINPEVLSASVRGRFDALVVHGYSAITRLMLALSPRPGRPALLMYGDSNPADPRSPLKRLTKRAALNVLFRRFEHFLYIGEANRAYYLEYGVALTDLTRAPLAVDNEFFGHGAAKARAHREQRRAGFGLPTSIPLFIFCGKLVEGKRPLDILRSFAIARARIPCGLVIVGDGQMRDQIHAEAARLGIGDSTFLLGFRNQSELPELFGLCDGLILASEREAWGLVINEAMAAGLAIASSTTVGASRDLVTPDNGACFRTGDVSELARILERWARHPELLQQLGRASAERIRSWSYEQTVSGFIAGAEKALARQARRVRSASTSP